MKTKIKRVKAWAVIDIQCFKGEIDETFHTQMLIFRNKKQAIKQGYVKGLNKIIPCTITMRL